MNGHAGKILRVDLSTGKWIEIDTADYRTPLFMAAVSGQLGRLDEAKRAVSEMRSHLTMPTDGIRTDLIQRNVFAPELADHLMDGLRKAGFEDVR